MWHTKELKDRRNWEINEQIEGAEDLRFELYERWVKGEITTEEWRMKRDNINSYIKVRRKIIERRMKGANDAK